MVSEKVYELDDGTEMILLDRMVLESNRYLLLSERKSNDLFVAYEQDGNLNFIDELSSEYNEIFSKLFEKYNNSLTN